MTIKRINADGQKKWEINYTTAQMIYWCLGCVALLLTITTPWIRYNATQVVDDRVTVVKADLSNQISLNEKEHLKIEQDFREADNLMRQERLVQIQDVNRRLDDIKDLLIQMGKRK